MSEGLKDATSIAALQGMESRSVFKPQMTVRKQTCSRCDTIDRSGIHEDKKSDRSLHPVKLSAERLFETNLETKHRYIKHVARSSPGKCMKTR